MKTQLVRACCETTLDKPHGGKCDVPTARLRQRPEDQPLPKPNDRPAIAVLVAVDLQARMELGTRRYGTPLQAHNGRDALRDAYEEALDLTCYLRQAIEERDNPEQGDHHAVIHDFGPGGCCHKEEKA